MEKKIAYCGLGPILGPDCTPMKKTRRGWQIWANREAKRMAARDGIEWSGVVADLSDIPFLRRDVFRVSFGYQKI